MSYNTSFLCANVLDTHAAVLYKAPGQASVHTWAALKPNEPLLSRLDMVVAEAARLAASQSNNIARVTTVGLSFPLLYDGVSQKFQTNRKLFKEINRIDLPAWIRAKLRADAVLSSTAEAVLTHTEATPADMSFSLEHPIHVGWLDDAESTVLLNDLSKNYHTEGSDLMIMSRQMPTHQHTQLKSIQSPTISDLLEQVLKGEKHATLLWERWSECMYDALSEIGHWHEGMRILMNSSAFTENHAAKILTLERFQQLADHKKGGEFHSAEDQHLWATYGLMKMIQSA